MPIPYGNTGIVTITIIIAVAMIKTNEHHDTTLHGTPLHDTSRHCTPRHFTARHNTTT